MVKICVLLSVSTNAMQTIKKIFIGTLVIVLFFGAIIFYKAPALTSFRDKTNYSEGYNKYCGYLIKCQYYNYSKPSTLEIEIHQPDSNNDRDYYYYYKGLRCQANQDIELIKVNFKSSDIAIPFKEIRQGKSIILNTTIQQEEIQKQNDIALHVSFKNGQQEQIILLKKHTAKDFNTKDTEIIFIFGIFFFIAYTSWILALYFIAKKFDKYSIYKRQIIAGVISLLISICLLSGLTKFIVSC